MPGPGAVGGNTGQLAALGEEHRHGFRVTGQAVTEGFALVEIQDVQLDLVGPVGAGT